MALSSFKQMLVANEIDRALHDTMVARKICRTDYSGQIIGQGDTVRFPAIAKPTIAAYTAGTTTVTAEGIVDSSLDLIVDKANYYAFKVLDSEAALSKGGAMGVGRSQVKEAAYQLAYTMDADILGSTGISASAGNTATAATVTTALCLSMITEMRRYLYEQNVYGKAWLVIPPWLMTKLSISGVKWQIANSGEGSGGAIQWAEAQDWDIYVSNQLYNSGTAAAPITTVIGGSYKAVGLAEKTVSVDDFRVEADFATGYKGLHVYGYKVLRPVELVKCAMTWAIETTV